MEKMRKISRILAVFTIIFLLVSFVQRLDEQELKISRASIQESEALQEPETMQGTNITPESETTQGSETAQESEMAQETEGAQESETTQGSDASQGLETTQGTEGVQDSEIMPEPEGIQGSEVTPEPEGIQGSEVTPEPEGVQGSEVTPESEFTQDSENAQDSEVTKPVEISQGSEITQSPDSTRIPEMTQQAKITQEPKMTQGAKITETTGVPKESQGEDGEKDEEEESDVEEPEIQAMAISDETVSGGKMTIRVAHDFDAQGAEIALCKDGQTIGEYIAIGTAGIGTFVFDLDSTSYDSFFITKKGDGQVGNNTIIIDKAELQLKKQIYGNSLVITVGGWKNATTSRDVSYGVLINIGHDFTGGISVHYTKNGQWVSTAAIYPENNIIFDLESSDYDGFYVEEKDTTMEGNKTEILTALEIQEALAGNGGMLVARVGGWNGENIRRTLTLQAIESVSDMSLDIPVGEFTKEKGTLYVNATFYDYYSDYALEGKNRKELSGGMGGSYSDNKQQSQKFNSAVAAYFQGTSLATSGWQSPLYFGEFNGTNQSFLNFKYDNNNGGNNNGGARLNLVNDNLVGNKLVMGTDNIEVPYFNTDFLRGNNSLNDNIGYVFENVSFPFIKNSDNYWEFDSYNANQTLRMKQTEDGAYFLDRVGSGNSVHGHDAYNSTANSNFFPFNDKTESGDPIKLNYGFGARIDIPFYMTADGKVQTDIDTYQDITFDFLGDDDIWIFIDGKLVLDIGGDHGAVNGNINFATCQAKTKGMRRGANNNPEWFDGTTSFERLNSTDRHTLSLFYMERGLWESNMKITFNFPQSNKLSVEKEVVIPTKDGKSVVNEKFANAVKKLNGTDASIQKVAFPITIKNLATSGEAVDPEMKNDPIRHELDNITQSSNIWNYNNSPAKGEKIHDGIPGEGHDYVLKYTCQGTVDYKAGTGVADSRSIVIGYINNELNLDDATVERMKECGYVEFDAYLDASTGGGPPFLALIDNNGRRIGGWTKDTVYAGTDGNIHAGEWVTMRVYISRMAMLDGDFNYSKIKGIQFAYWDNKPVYVDNISIHAPAVYTSIDGFARDQNAVPAYGSIESQKLELINGAEYGLTGTDRKFHVDDGIIYLQHDWNTLFADQFRRNSYLYIREQCNTNVFDVQWSISENGKVKKSGVGTTVNDERDAREFNNRPHVPKPTDPTMLFQTYGDDTDETKFYNLDVKFTNTLKTGSLTIKKKVTNKNSSQIDQNALADVTIPYVIQVSFSNVAALGLEGDDAYIEQTPITFNENLYLDGENDVYVIDGIPAGTDYQIREIQTEVDANFESTGLVRDDFVLEGISEDGTNTGAWDEESGSYRGTIKANVQAEVIITNDINPVIDMTNMNGEKLWKLVDEEDSRHGNTKLEKAPEGKSVILKLQRRFIKGTGDDDATYTFEDVTPDGSTPITIKLEKGKTSSTSTECRNYYYNSSEGIKSYQTEVKITTDGWKYSVEGLPLYGMITGRTEEGSNLASKKGRRRKYEYRFVETQVVTANGDGAHEMTTEVELADDGVKYKENNSGYITSGGTRHATTVTDETGTETEIIDYNITNVYDPATNLQITKVSGDENNSKPMDGVEFELVRFVKNASGELVPDPTFNGNSGSITGITGDGSGTLTFVNLPDGTYQLTEVKTVEGYSLLAKPVKILINHSEGCVVEEDKSYYLESDGKTLQLLISNQGLLELPNTGSRGRYIMIISGILLVILGETFYLWNMYHQNRLRRARRRN